MFIDDSPVCKGAPISIDISLTLGAPPCPPPRPCIPEQDHDYAWQERTPQCKDALCLEDLIKTIMGCLDSCGASSVEIIEEPSLSTEPPQRTSGANSNKDFGKTELNNSTDKSKELFDKSKDKEEGKDE